MRTVLSACAVAGVSMLGFALWGGAAAAEPYVDYTPQKGLWHVTTVKVDPNHIDDYLAGLRRTWVPSEEISKKHGLIDSYQVMVKFNASDGQGNVLLIEHIPNSALLDPDQARDQALQRENYAAVPKAQGEQAVAGYDKYRTFVGDDYWGEMAFPK
ncbi:hypothetical protein ACO2Q3_02825 [Caulobacter sp. KR2-114]|uniref:hypothetical protein n=1 Tax=Caulobacter sp. KR2-114 TaxID=3400912 RepID=UPI003C06DB0B